MFHTWSFDDFAAPHPHPARPTAAPLVAEVAARRKRSAVQLALTGQLLADVRELLAHVAAELAREQRNAARPRGEGQGSRGRSKSRRVRRGGRSRR